MDQIALPDLAWRLSASAWHHLIHTLCALLPPPVDATPQALAARNEAAIDAIAAMLPVNADEAALAARCVAARARADEILRLLLVHAEADLKVITRLNAQYMAMERTATAVHRELQRTQAARHKREANGDNAQADEWTQHIAQQRMTQALSGQPLAEAAETAQAPTAPADPPPPEIPAAQPTEPAPDLAAEADRYALTYTDRARLIRRLGDVPPDCTFGPPEPEVIRAIPTGTSAILRALDTEAA